MNAIVIAVGDELVSGQTVDTNSAWLSRRLGRRGVVTVAHRTVADRREAIADAIRESAARAGLVVVSGGLGPTADDVTREGLADAMGVELQLDAECLVAIESFFRRRGRQMVPTNRRQAMVPSGADPIRNEAGTAPGIAARIGPARVFVLPGVPHEMRRMYADGVAPELGAAGGVVLHKVIHTFGTGESDVAGRIADLMERGAETAVGTTVAAGLVSIRITAQGADEHEAEERIRPLAEEIRRRLGDLVVAEGDGSMASAVGALLRRAGATLATAESCTGGMAGEMITSVAGSSAYYLGGVVAYDNRVKIQALGVSEEAVAAGGAVSEAVAAAMATGCRERLASDWAISITGIAGPGGGSEDKPVGLVYVGLAGPGGVEVHRHVFPGDRQIVRRRAALAALNHLRLRLLAREDAQKKTAP